MPEDRLTHPRVGRSRKVGQLDDFAYRVWEQYRVSCDDYGVMPESAALLRGANVRLERSTDDDVQRAIDQMSDVGLVHRFEDQGVRYLYSRTWQDHQKIKYPRATHYPCPIPEELSECSKDTVNLFRKHPKSDPRTVQEHSENKSGPRARGRARNANANANARGGSGGSELFARFWAAYPRKVGKAKAEQSWRKLCPDAEVVAAMLAALAWQRTMPQWLKDGGEFIPHPATWLNQRRWEDERAGGESSAAAPSAADSIAKTQRYLAELRSGGDTRRSGGEAA